jgi:hypothetical protein
VNNKLIASVWELGVWSLKSFKKCLNRLALQAYTHICMDGTPARSSNVLLSTGPVYSDHRYGDITTLNHFSTPSSLPILPTFWICSPVGWHGYNLLPKHFIVMTTFTGLLEWISPRCSGKLNSWTEQECEILVIEISLMMNSPRFWPPVKRRNAKRNELLWIGFHCPIITELSVPITLTQHMFKLIKYLPGRHHYSLYSVMLVIVWK